MITITYLDVAFNKLGYGDRVHLEAGLVNVDGFRLAVSNEYMDADWGLIYEDVVVQTVIEKDDRSSVEHALLKIFDAVFEAAGHERPPNYNGFPKKQTP